MNNIFKFGTGCLLMAISSTCLISCSDADEQSILDSAIVAKTITFDLPSDLQQTIYSDATGTNILPLIKGTEVELGYKLEPEDITFNEVIWNSTNTEVVTCNNGLIKAVSGDGTGYSIVSVIPVGVYSGSGIYSSLKIVVSNELIKAETITLNSDISEVFAGETLQLNAEILPEDATYHTVNWSSSDPTIATVDNKGLVTGVVNPNFSSTVTITATSLDGAAVIGTKDIIVKQIVQPEDITLDQSYSVDNNYLVAIADNKIQLNYVTVPAECTKSLIKWSTSDEAIATVDGGVVSINQNGVFGDVTITATCPSTGKTSATKMHVEEGLVRELYHDENNYSWYNAKQSGNGTSSSHVWSYGKVTVTTYTQNATKQRGDFKCWSPKTWLNAGTYPILAIRMEDLKDKLDAVTARNITLDASGSCDGTTFSGGLDGNNNKWLHDYKCSDGTHVLIYDLSTQKWATGGVLPTTSTATFTTLQFKYADIATLTEQVTYDVHWVQTFKSMDDLKKYIESEGLTYDIVK